MESDFQNRRVLMVLIIVVLLAWDLPLLLPLRMLVVTFHELGHAAAALMTGGEVIEMAVGINEGGMTVTKGGVHFIILNGGYLGSLMVGVGLLLLSRRPRSGHWISIGMGIMLTIAAIAWFSWLTLGFVFVLTVGIALVTLGLKASSTACDLVVRLVGVFSVLYAVFDIRSDVFGRVSDRSDAAVLAEMTGIPAILWGIAWLVVGGFVLWRLRDRLT